MTIIDDLQSEANELVRLESNLNKMIHQHRDRIFDVLGERPERETVQNLVQILGQTDFKGYFRDLRKE